MESCIRDAYRKNCKISLKENWKYRIRNTVESCTHTGNGIFPDIFRGRGLTCGGVGGAWREEQSSFADRSETKLSRNFRQCSPPPFHLWSIRAREQGDRLSAMKESAERDRKEKCSLRSIMRRPFRTNAIDSPLQHPLKVHLPIWNWTANKRDIRPRPRYWTRYACLSTDFPLFQFLVGQE